MKSHLYTSVRSLVVCIAGLATATAGYGQANTGAAALDINNTSTILHVAGDHFYDLNSKTARFEAPKGSGKSTIFSSALWLAATNSNNDLHIAAMTYRQNGSDFWAGPLQLSDGSITSGVSLAFDHVYVITRKEIEDFRKNGTLTANITSWPGYDGRYPGCTKDLAPFVDTDHDGLYDPSKGDYPDMKGDMMLWWIFNDNAAAHGETGGQPLKMEIHAKAYAYGCTTDPVLSNTLFFEYDMYNRSGESYHTTAGIFTDFDLGYAFDDYVGTYQKGNSYFGYNGKDFDTTSMGYGWNPPVQSVTFLTDSLYKSIAYSNDFTTTGNPDNATQYYYLLTGRWKNGNSIKYGKGGYSATGTDADFIFPDDPFSGTGWSEATAGTKPGDRRMLASIKPFDLAPGGHKSMAFAYTFNQLPNGNRKDNYYLMTQNVQALQKMYASGISSVCTYSGIVSENALSSYVQVFPNPATDNIQLRWQTIHPQQVVLSNEYGQVVYSSQISENMTSVQLNTANMASGVYILSMYTSEGCAVQKVAISK